MRILKFIYYLHAVNNASLYYIEVTGYHIFSSFTSNLVIFERNLKLRRCAIMNGIQAKIDQINVNTIANEICGLDH